MDKRMKMLGLTMLISVVASLAVACGADPTPTATSAPPTPTATSAPSDGDATPTPTTAAAPTPTRSTPPTPTPTPEPDIADQFRGKNIVLIVHYGPGGGYDLVARNTANTLKAKLGARSVIIQNRAAGSGLAALNFMITKAKPDGLTIMNTNVSSFANNQLLGKLDYDMQVLPPIARTRLDEAPLLYTRGDLNIAPGDLDALRALDAVKVAGSGRFDNGHLGIAGLFENFNISKGKYIAGYQGTSDTVLSMLKGEIEMASNATMSTYFSQRENFDNGDFNMFTVIAPERNALLPDVPTWLELGDWDDTLAAGMLSRQNAAMLSSVWTVPPGTPDNIVNFLRGTWDEMWADNSEMRQRLTTLYSAELVQYTTGAALEEAITGLLGSPYTEAQLADFQTLMEKY